MTAFIPKSFIDELLTRCDIVELINHCIPLRKRGSNHIACCPFHEESTPSFSVSETKQIYHCFGCGVGGNAISFIMHYERLDFVSAIEWLSNHFQLTIPKSKPGLPHANRLPNLYAALSDSVHFYQEQLYKNPKALHYLKERGVSTISIEQFSIGFAPAEWDALSKFLRNIKKHSVENLQTAGLVIKKDNAYAYDRFRARIIFPIRDKQGRFIALGGRVLHNNDEPKYLNSPETPIFYKSKELYGLYESNSTRKKADRIWVVEGYLDVVTWYQFGIVPVVATLGTSTSASHLNQLFRLTEEVVFCFDGDAAGEKAAIRALELGLQSIRDVWTIRFLLLPKGEDPDSWIRKLTFTDATQLLLHTLSIEDFLFQHLTQSVNLDTLEGQRQLLQKAIPMLKKMPPNIRRVQLFQRLSNLINIEVDQLESVYSKLHSLRPKVSSQPTKPAVIDRAIGLLLQYPRILFSYLKTINQSLRTEYPILVELINLIQSIKNPHTAIILEQFRESPKINYLIKLAQYDWLVPAEGVVAEFQDILIHLSKSIRTREVKALIQKAHESKLSATEEAHLKRLLSECSSVDTTIK